MSEEMSSGWSCISPCMVVLPKRRFRLRPDIVVVPQLPLTASRAPRPAGPLAERRPPQVLQVATAGTGPDGAGGGEGGRIPRKPRDCATRNLHKCCPLDHPAPGLATPVGEIEPPR